MLEKSKSIWIFWKLRETYFQALNKNVIPEEPRMIGSSVTSVTKITANSKVMESIMPSVIGTSPNSQDWNKKLTDYWNNLSVEVGVPGKELEIGFIYDITSTVVASTILDVNRVLAANDKTKDKLLTTDEDLYNYMESRLESIIADADLKIKEASKLSNDRAREERIDNIYRNKWESIYNVESERYKFGRPIKAEDYVLYLFLLNYRDVANEAALSDKSNHIRFYLHSKDDIEKEQQQRISLERSRMNKYVEVIKNFETVENVIFAMGKGDNMPVNDIDKLSYLEGISKSETKKFISTCDNKDIKSIGKIERYIKAGIFNRLSNSSIIVDAYNVNNVIGNNINEAITYINNKENAAIVSEFELKYKNLPK